MNTEHASSLPTLAFIYDREVTKEDKADERVASCREYAAKMGWAVAGQWVDRGTAAVSLRRPAWVGMVETMKLENRARGLVCLVTSWDRVAFDPEAGATLRQSISKLGGVCIAANDESTWSPRDAAMAALRSRGHEVAPGVTLVSHDASAERPGT